MCCNKHSGRSRGDHGGRGWLGTKGRGVGQPEMLLFPSDKCNKQFPL